MIMKKFKYVEEPLKNAEMENGNCQICGEDKLCLEGIYFDNDDEVELVCLDCLQSGKIKVNIPSFLEERIYSHLFDLYPQYKKSEIEIKAKTLSEELSINPPVPWIQYNDWAVCCGDFAKYIGEWNKEDILKKSSNGKEYIMDILDDFSKKKVEDIDAFWDDIGESTVIFVFKCIKCSKLIAVSQAY